MLQQETLLWVEILLKMNAKLSRLGVPLITYAPRGRVGGKSLIYFYCVLHAMGGGGGSRYHVKMRA